ncbi:serine hydrolase domain-containing protein [Glacieibacterium frigidum]|uniref:Serine hydrolase n=1 Tax=Glacieibacterium frigidum TaxID=2593303 RepID=A0A552U8U6_9SPHN|nr:serine hydrolase [Glacieibacterium frigidum]TRW14609.1 serine hydrolase [Glacieibacterium frigidum]
MRGGATRAILLALLCVATPAVATPAQDSAVAALFAPAAAETRAVVVMQDGRIVAERYGPGYSAANRFISWSMAKSITATLIGMLVDEGKLRLDDPAPVPAWAKDGRRAVTLRQLLHMSSGLRHDEQGEPQVQDSDTNRALFADRSADMLGAAIAVPLIAKPGTDYDYSSQTSVILAGIVQRTIAPGVTDPAARRKAMRDFMAARLGFVMPSLICEYDARGTMIGGSLCHATARDWANFGQVYLDGGRFGGRQVVSPAWVEFVRTPAATNPSYGGHFWLNRARPGAKSDALFPDQGPPDTYSPVGHLGQYVTITPSKRLIVVRLGKTQDDRLGPVKVALGRLVNSYP